MSVRDEIKAANERYAASFTKSELPMPPARRFAVVTCMDARLDPAKSLGLEEGDAHVIRNAGGLVSDDGLRSLVISHWLLGTQEAFVIAHTDCGMLTFTNDQLRRKLADEAGADASGVDFLPFSDLEGQVRESVQRIRESPLLPDSFAASGFVYDVHSGRLSEIVVPSAAGARA
jgi:carbonic anhydrase